MQDDPRNSSNRDEGMIKETSDPDLLEGDDGPNGLLNHIQKLASRLKRNRDVPPSSMS